MNRVDVTTFSMVDRVEGQMRVSVREDGSNDARLSVGRGIEWIVKWCTGQAIPTVEGMTPEHREELVASASYALQRLRDRPPSGFTPREEPSTPSAAAFA